MLATRPTRWWLVVALGGGLAALACAPRASAQQTPAQIFEEARQAYNRGEYAEVVDLLEPMVGGEVPTIGDRILVRESRKYLGAAYALTSSRDAAVVQFETMLRGEGADLEHYTLDTALFPASVHEVFDEVRARLVRELRDDADAQERQRLQRETRRTDAMMQLVSLAQEDEVELENSLALAVLPFGIGQFQNGDDELGAFFAVSESIFVTAAAVSLAAWFPLQQQWERSLVDPTAAGVDPDALLALQVVNWVSVGASLVLMVAGIVEAVTSFRPRRTVRRQRPIPDPILHDLELLASPTGLGLRLRF